MDKSKSQMKREEVMGHASPSAEAKATHRYVCDACTGTAGVSNIPDAVKQITCGVCGKVQNCKPENWIKI